MANAKTFNVAVVGATGAVGTQILRLLEERNFPISQLKCLSSARSAGATLTFKGQEIIVEEATPESFEGIDFALFSAGGSVSKALAQEAVQRGAVVIDNTNAFRMTPEVPLVVPEVNMEKAFEHQGIIANPNCSTIQMVAALQPIKEKYGIDRIIVSTYQAVSGAGNRAIGDLVSQTQAVLEGKEANGEILPVGSLPKKHQMAFNVIPQIDVFQENGFTLEEMKMINETKKIFGDENVKVAATCVRVPVLNGHSESVYVETKEDFNLDEIKELLAHAPGVTLIDDPAEQAYPLATDSTGKLEVFVGRLRKDVSEPRGLHMWIVSDNLLKGAAWNAVQIAEQMAAKFEN
ncbi:aspartate-semialdehyde dehydrogenase [Ammoniphilus sp. CFH 90114]|uniref:aspartate-semialdehyde dehydrogenase n=1 Tax=Ammoniphilus sp. CFH 90114 TaxID=2493665 RepID=UPI00100EFEA7|nr:aspartate-semialdehyde dehydrogenase [Ammoniphilus sp. CFH 90114]RXT15171.1 aspartate-semialdehyde dehydrogenase [Ammoniphilus sp. CFH 90114]